MRKNAGRIRVVIVDDSALIRQLLTEIINDTPDLEVVGAAPDPLVAREMIRSLSPDVITLDVEMPKMDGLSFLEKLMRLRPMPVVMISSLTDTGAETTLRALELGAVDFVSKPKFDVGRGVRDYAQEITDKLRAAARAKVRKLAPMTVDPAKSADAVLPLKQRVQHVSGRPARHHLLGAAAGVQPLAGQLRRDPLPLLGPGRHPRDGRRPGHHPATVVTSQGDHDAAGQLTEILLARTADRVESVVEPGAPGGPAVQPGYRRLLRDLVHQRVTHAGHRCTRNHKAGRGAGSRYSTVV